jgi:hypothetical protein
VRGYVECREKQEMNAKFSLVNLNGRNYSEDLGVDKRIIL